MDENYLDLIRDNLYNKGHKNKGKHVEEKSKKRKKLLTQSEDIINPKNMLKTPSKSKKDRLKHKRKLEKKLRNDQIQQEVSLIESNDNNSAYSINNVESVAGIQLKQSKNHSIKVKSHKHKKKCASDSHRTDEVISDIIEPKVSPVKDTNALTNHDKDHKNIITNLFKPKLDVNMKKPKKRKLLDSNRLENKYVLSVSGNNLDKNEPGNKNTDNRQKKKLERIKKAKKNGNKYTPSISLISLNSDAKRKIKLDEKDNNAFIGDVSSDKNKLTKKNLNPSKVFKKKKVKQYKEWHEDAERNILSVTSLEYESKSDNGKEEKSFSNSFETGINSDVQNSQTNGYFHSQEETSKGLEVDFLKHKKRKRTDKSDDKGCEDYPLTTVSDDDEGINVQGLEFQRFCTLFKPAPNEQYLGNDSTLKIPVEHFKIEKDLDLDSSDKNIPKPKHSNKKLRKQGDGNKFKEKTKQINILDVQVIKPDQSTILPNDKSEENMLQNGLLSSSIELSINCEDEPMKAENLKESIANNSKQYLEVETFAPPETLNLTNGDKIIFLEPSKQFHLHGLCLIEILHGKVEILGAELGADSGERKVYSPRGSALLYVKNVFNLYIYETLEVRKLVKAELWPKEELEMQCDKNSAVILCKALKEPYVDFIERHVSQKMFPEIDDPGPRIDCSLQGSWNRLQTNTEWEEIVENIRNKSTTVICGGKGVGKSTFIRYVINKLLGKFEKIRLVDLDPGQPEMTPPGCISVVTVDGLILGPNYTHLQKPDSMILCHINIGYDIERYLCSVKYLLNFAENQDAMVTLINFPGFTQGLGLDMTARALDLIRPDLVVQINSSNPGKNFKMDLTMENVKRNVAENIICKNISTNRCELNYQFLKLDSLSDNNEAWSLEARQGREINLLSYLGKMMTLSARDLTSVDDNMYSINWAALSITNLEGKTVSPLAMNANLVALCSQIADDSSIFLCHGYGFVRGINPDTETLVLLTPEAIETLDKVDRLVLGSVTTPPSLIMTTADSVKGLIPYVNVGEPIEFGQFTKRSYLPARK